MMETTEVNMKVEDRSELIGALASYDSADDEGGSAIADGPAPVASMLVYCAHNCNTEFETEVEELECGAGQIVCLECDGSGRCLFPPEMVGGELACVDCKGTGRQLVSI
ncbi:hypothetical protein [Bradyrhizobium lupini]|uniref:hypothetical protein n=1 Tax=Rhizobium lupini TaxID=136996 RepID=UPI0034C6D38C